MKAIVITTAGGPEVLQTSDYPKPRATDDEVLIKVKAAGLNRSDIFQRQGNYPPPPGVPEEIPGLEVSGIVEDCGPNVSQWEPGDHVCALIAGGGYAEYVRVRQGQCLPIPSNLSFVEAAGLPETVFTVWSNIFERGSLKPGETLLVHGGSSGIGTTAIQLAHALNSRVYVTVGSEQKGQACRKLGADRYINYKTDDFEALLGEEGVDVILDMVGGSYFEKNCRILHPEGRLVYINAMAQEPASINIRLVMQKRLTITGSTLRGREYAYKKHLAGSVLKNVWPLIESGEFRPLIYKTIPLSEASAAHRLMEENRHMGKIILEV
jgi:putative PIG3 family NAD(P)H quinone oxidoreductase